VTTAPGASKVTVDLAGRQATTAAAGTVSISNALNATGAALPALALPQSARATAAAARAGPPTAQPAQLLPNHPLLSELLEDHPVLALLGRRRRSAQ
jgi:hypothetical protein